MKKVFAAMLALVLTIVILAVVAFLPLSIGHSIVVLLPEATGISWFLWRWGAGVLSIAICTACCILYDAVYSNVCDWYDVP